MEYKAKHSKEEYFDIIIKERVQEIEDVDPEWMKKQYGKPYKYQTFSVCSQHVRGYTPEHCLDKVIAASKAKEERIKYYKTLPTLEELVNGDQKIEPGNMYYYKSSGPEDSCNGLNGMIILTMREKGLDEVLKEWREEEFKWLMGL